MILCLSKTLTISFKIIKYLLLIKLNNHINFLNKINLIFQKYYNMD